jgi:predicted nucleotidyltransferase
MAKFKCNQSGNTIEFFQEHEIAEMRKHGGYTEVVETPVVVETAPVKSTKKSKVTADESSISGDDSNSGN